MRYSLLVCILIGIFTCGNIYASDLSGTYILKTQEGTIQLIFQTKNLLIFNGQEIAYMLVPGSIRIAQDNQFVDYPYVFSGGKLCVTDPQGYQLCYTKISNSTDQGNKHQAAQQQGSSDLARLLLSTAWCSFSYSGSNTGSVSSGYSSSSRVQFFSNGTYTLGKRGQGSSTGHGGAYSSQDDQGSGGRWTVQNNQLYLSEGSGPLELTNVQVTYNNNGSPILKSEGKEYMRCD